jgi:hypothetical protein
MTPEIVNDAVVPAKAGPMVPYTGISGIWVPAYARTTQCAVGNFVATVIEPAKMAAIIIRQ